MHPHMSSYTLQRIIKGKFENKLPSHCFLVFQSLQASENSNQLSKLNNLSVPSGINFASLKNNIPIPSPSYLARKQLDPVHKNYRVLSGTESKNIFTQKYMSREGVEEGRLR